MAIICCEVHACKELTAPLASVSCLHVSCCVSLPEQVTHSGPAQLVVAHQELQSASCQVLRGTMHSGWLQPRLDSAVLTLEECKCSSLIVEKVASALELLWTSGTSQEGSFALKRGLLTAHC